MSSLPGQVGRGAAYPLLAGVVGIASAASGRRSGSQPASTDGTKSLPPTPEGWASAAVVSCATELDLTNVPELREALLTAWRTNPVVVVDMSETVFCDASVARSLVEAHERATASGGELRVVVACPAVMRVLAVMGADQLFQISSSLSEALSGRFGSNRERVWHAGDLSG